MSLPQAFTDTLEGFLSSVTTVDSPHPSQSISLLYGGKGFLCQCGNLVVLRVSQDTGQLAAFTEALRTPGSRRGVWKGWEPGKQ